MTDINPQMLTQLRARTAYLFRKAYPGASAQQAWNFRLQRTGKSEIKDWNIVDFKKAIRYLEDRLKSQERRAG